jgi:hypothetical protein
VDKTGNYKNKSKEPSGMALSTVNRIITLFDDALQALSASITMAQTERMGILVHHTMEAKTRAYHTAGHVFNMCEDMNPRQVLAALFHDIVYFQLDGGFPALCRPLLEGVTRTEGDGLVLQAITAQDDMVALCAAVFGFTPGQVLPLYCGMNEFLSAVVAARLLQPHLKPLDLLGVVACIESTIPFGKPDDQGNTALERLAMRIEQQYDLLKPGSAREMIRSDVDHMVWDAVKIANRDVSSFAVAEPGIFLSSTWLLIEESNAPLKDAGMYNLQEYRHGLVRMDGFLRALDPDHVFHQFKGLPTDADMDSLRAVASGNISFACDFLGAKITSIAMIEALALCTGTDGPISMFLGDIRSTYGRPDRVDAFLPQAPNTQVLNPDLLRVFEKGRTQESSNDLTTSPITAFVYRYMGHAGTQQALHNARDMFKGAITPLAFLRTLNRSMVSDIVHASAGIAPSRRDALHTLAQLL